MVACVRMNATGVDHPVSIIVIDLIGVGDADTIVTGVANTIAVSVALAWVCNLGAVVIAA